MYDFAALSLGDVLLGKLPFKQLHVDGFDTEQVWGQIALFSKQMDKRTKRLLRKIGPDAKLLTEVAENDIDALLGGSGKDGEVSSICLNKKMSKQCRLQETHLDMKFPLDRVAAMVLVSLFVVANCLMQTS